MIGSHVRSSRRSLLLLTHLPYGPAQPRAALQKVKNQDTFRGINPVMVRQIKRAERASILSYPKTFHARQIAANGTKLHVRVGGTGPAVVLLHGYGETGDMPVPLANDLERDRTVIVPDLRGMGLSAKPASGYDKKRKATTSRAFSMRSRSSA